MRYRKLRNKLIKKKNELLALHEEVQNFIDGIRDGMTRQIIINRYINGYSWTKDDEYKKAYNVYLGKTGPSGLEAGAFLGVAFYSEEYKKLVADKIFLGDRSIFDAHGSFSCGDYI
jgi:hypothetical protein